MKINRYGYPAEVNTARHQEPSPVEEKAEETAQLPEEEQAVIQDFRMDKEEEASFLEQLYFGDVDEPSTVEKGIQMSGSKPSNSAPALTRRLVIATGQFEVRQIIADANKQMLNLHMIAAVGGEDGALARAYIKQLDKLINRADRKIKNLDNEDGLKIQKSRAEQKKQQKRAEEIKVELRKQEAKRRLRENGYLLELLQEEMNGLTGQGGGPALDAGSEAAIAAAAEAMAAAEFAMGGGDVGGGEMAAFAGEVSGGGGGEVDAGGGGSEGGGEVAL